MIIVPPDPIICDKFIIIADVEETALISEAVSFTTSDGIYDDGSRPQKILNRLTSEFEEVMPP